MKLELCLKSFQKKDSNFMKIYDRNVVDTILSDMETPKIQILVGTRQVGKTTILNIIKGKLKRDKRQVIKINLENPEFANIFNTPQNIIDFLVISGFDLSQRIFLLLDEFQNFPGIDKVLKFLYDEYKNIKIIATGSSSLLLNRNIKEGLTGRNFIYNVYHFDFYEFANVRNSTLLCNMMASDRFIDMPEVTRIIEEYFLFGGYPEVILHPTLEMKQKIFSSIYISYLEKDINFFISSANTFKFSNLVELLAEQIGCLVNMNSLAETLRIAHKTVENYLFILEQTFSVKLLPPFCRNKEKEIRRMKKAYFYDLGLRNYVLKLQRLSLDQGTIAENFALIEMLRNNNYSIKYWRTKNGTEIDFILERYGEIIPVEVKYKNRVNTNIVPRNLKSFINQYEIKMAYVLTKNQQGELVYNGKRIIFKPIIFARNIN